MAELGAYFTVEGNGPYRQLSVDSIPVDGLLNERESIIMAVKLIYAAEELLPPLLDEETQLAEIRKALKSAIEN